MTQRTRTLSRGMIQSVLVQCGKDAGDALINVDGQCFDDK